MTTAITLLLLRHGERADEAADFRRGPPGSRSTKDRMDPVLTELGHQQATEAFRRIVPFLKNKRSLIFVSPLKRTMATAAMVGMHEEIKISSRPAIPLIVMNGLCDCAAHVQLAGGAHSAVRHGYIDGAVMDDNDRSMESPLMKMLQESQEIQNLKRPIQFYKEHDGEIIAISEPVGGGGATTDNSEIHDATTTGGEDPIDNATSVTSLLDSRSKYDDLFTWTIKRIAQIAATRGCDTCVVVTHREGIRNLASSINGGDRHYPTPYCCIGKFTAQADSNGIATDWKIDGVCPYEEFSSTICSG